jgi:hypothetical protein
MPASCPRDWAQGIYQQTKKEPGKKKGATRNHKKKYKSINIIARKPGSILWAGDGREQKDMTPYEAIIQVDFKQLAPNANQLFVTGKSL